MVSDLSRGFLSLEVFARSFWVHLLPTKRLLYSEPVGASLRSSEMGSLNVNFLPSTQVKPASSKSPKGYWLIRSSHTSFESLSHSSPTSPICASPPVRPGKFILLPRVPSTWQKTQTRHNPSESIRIKTQSDLNPAAPGKTRSSRIDTTWHRHCKRRIQNQHDTTCGWLALYLMLQMR